MVYWIYTELTHEQLPEISDEDYHMLIQMYKEALDCFENDVPPEVKGTRVNMIHVNYCANKFCIIRGLYHLLPVFQLPKQDKKLAEYDRIFSWICENKKGEQWTFRRSL